MVTKAPPLQEQADSVAHGLFTFTSVNPDCEHYYKQAPGILFQELPLPCELGLFTSSYSKNKRLHLQ